MSRAVVAILSCALLTVTCDSPVTPTSSISLDQFVQALGRQGLRVSVGDEIAPNVNGFFSVPAQQVRVNDTQLSVFIYRDADAAAAEAALISPDGQPSPTTRVAWISTPHFYRQEAMIVLYVGCTSQIIQALQVTVGTPFVVGRTPCDVAN